VFTLVRVSMQTLHAKWTTFIDHQHRYPTGIVGQLIGERMVRQHMPETVWTIELLDLQSTDYVLELGFGAGRGLALATQQATRGMVMGIDLSATMVHVACRRNRTALRSGRMALLRGNLDALPFVDQQFDKLFSIHTFYFWSNPLQMVTELLGLLRPAGKLVVTLATGQMNSAGKWTYWSLHEQVETLVGALQQLHVRSAALKRGPNSRQYNNVAIVIQK
jgi:ubiquinone/menaquinone biosynthesis C-methylase UbiE